ncbi:hypothetical protein ACFQHO_01235 [Actinomadura yumaensis]|uniref:Uncharacterized protein n=1 Tax=Actinomadura yumaensis TaxID=111807 RepID=A0ABW2CFW2_9ACTN|nr:hypothetical protein [Actinomadura sp. J1-007]
MTGEHRLYRLALGKAGGDDRLVAEVETADGCAWRLRRVWR